jgi:hypothetical protein
MPAPPPQLVPPAGGFHPETAAVTPFPAPPARPSPRLEDTEAGDRRWALLLLAVTLLLMLSVIATGWFLIGGDNLPEPHGTVKSSVLDPARAGDL